MSKNFVQDLNEMHTKYGVHEAVSMFDKEKLRAYLVFRANFIQEELDELNSALTADDAVDALIDLVVVALGTLDAFGVDTYTAWDRVLTANMNKSVGMKESRKNDLGLPDLIKPAGWIAPSHADNVGLLSNVFLKDEENE